MRAREYRETRSSNRGGRAHRERDGSTRSGAVYDPPHGTPCRIGPEFISRSKLLHIQVKLALEQRADNAAEASTWGVGDIY